MTPACTSAFFAASHERHVSIWALVWFAYVPAVVATNPAGERLRRLWDRPSGPATQAVAGVVLAASATLFLRHEPWRLTVPGTTRVGAIDPYPVGPVEWLRANEGLDGLPDPLREAAELRLRYPTASLRELAARTEPAVTKAAMHRRLRLLEGHAGDRR